MPDAQKSNEETGLQNFFSIFTPFWVTQPLNERNLHRAYNRRKDIITDFASPSQVKTAIFD
jgi:hypothetical protein